MNLYSLFVFVLVVSAVFFQGQARPQGTQGPVKAVKRSASERSARRARSVGATVNVDSGQVTRLRGESGESFSGRVEVFTDGRWGIVCDDYWDLKDANVTCKELGFPAGATEALVEAPYGGSSLPNDAIAMDDTLCLGYERSIHECFYTDEHDCDIVEASGVVCKESEGCPNGWVYNRGLCYLMVGEAESFDGANQTCTREGGRLADVESQKENDFISDWITNNYDLVDNSGILIGGVKKNNKWSWPYSVLDFQFEKWFPGFEGEAPDLPTSAERCIALKNKFFSSDTYSYKNVDYFFWSAVNCDVPRAFICEKISQNVGQCYEGKGASYRGTAFRTDKGSLCQRWSDTSTNILTNPGAGLGGHNHCRNPDGDKKPWCWTDEENQIFGFCNLKPCTPTAVGVSRCQDQDEFDCYKSPQRKCIPSSWKCDGERDCPSGEDELICPIRLNEFTKISNKKLPEAVVYYSYFALLNDCVNLCLSKRDIICRSFTYNRQEEMCSLSEENIQTLSTALEASSESDVYETSSQAASGCSEFKCSNDKCIPQFQVCDGVDNCNDFSDENSCEKPKPFEIRLTGGQGKYEGTVEVRYLGEWGTICDDNWDMKDANVVCKQLGFKSATEAPDWAKFGEGVQNILLDEVACAGDESSIENCRHDRWRNHDCKTFEAAGVVCEADRGCRDGEWQCPNRKKCISLKSLCDGTNDCGDGTDERSCGARDVSVTLVGGANTREGRVQIRRGNGMIGSICDDSWDDNDATVICKMLGYKSGTATVESNFGKGQGKIWLDDVDCSGNEDNIINCKFPAWGAHDCTHDEDAGVICSYTDQATRAPPTMRPSEGPINCGTRPIEQPLSRIVGGFEAVHGAFPWQVSLQYGVGVDMWAHLCGATLISEFWIISAAHCFEGETKENLQAVLGEHSYAAVESTEQPFRIAELILHEQYQGASTGHDFDIALLKVRPDSQGRGVQFNNHVQPACLPTATTPYTAGTKCFISGWGTLSTGGQSPSILQAARVPIIGDADCKRMYRKYMMTDNMFCAGLTVGGIDTCQGDSGGPLVCDVQGKHTIMGVTSWGMDCAEPDFPGIYTNIGELMDWVNRKMRR